MTEEAPRPGCRGRSYGLCRCGLRTLPPLSNDETGVVQPRPEGRGECIRLDRKMFSVNTLRRVTSRLNLRISTPIQHVHPEAQRTASETVRPTEPVRRFSVEPEEAYAVSKAASESSHRRYGSPVRRCASRSRREPPGPGHAGGSRARHGLDDGRFDDG